MTLDPFSTDENVYRCPSIWTDYSARLGLMIRKALDPDFPEIEAVARASFPVPGDLFRRPGSCDHYRPFWRPKGGGPSVHVLLAENGRGHIAAYAYLQPRPDGDIYLRELAARPPDPRDRVPWAGAGLLGSGLALALQHHPGLRRVTLNVIGPHRRTCWLPAVGRLWRDPVNYYLGLGFHRADGWQSYVLSGSLRGRDDAWMVASLDDVLRRTHASINHALVAASRSLSAAEELATPAVLRS